MKELEKINAQIAKNNAALSEILEKARELQNSIRVLEKRALALSSGEATCDGCNI